MKRKGEGKRRRKEDAWDEVEEDEGHCSSTDHLRGPDTSSDSEADYTSNGPHKSSDSDFSQEEWEKILKSNRI